MRMIALPLALCIITLFACKGRENQQPPADSGMAAPASPSADSAATGQGAGAIGAPAESSAARDSATAKATGKTAPTSKVAPQKSGTQKTDSTQKSDSAPRKFKKPEVRPNYPPIDRHRTDTSVKDTTTRRDTSGER